MRVLFIGGTGIISTASTKLAIERGIEVTLLTRGHHAAAAKGARTITGDIATVDLSGEHFDAVVDWIAYTPDQIERDLRLFTGRTKQFIFISSASAYQKPSTDYLITESTPLENRYWQYSRDKIACEERLMRAYRDDGFPITIVRPSLTYGDTQITLAINCWEKSFTIIDRMRKGKQVIVPGDGSSLWTITHNTDFAKGLVGLLGNPQAIGHAFHITSDEVMTWNQYYIIAAKAAGVEDPKLVHIACDFITACYPDKRGSLTGDKAVSVVFDNSKIKRFVPGFCATTRYSVGVQRTIDWFDADPSRQQIDEESNRRWDLLIDAYDRGLKAAVASIGTS